VGLSRPGNGVPSAGSEWSEPLGYLAKQFPRQPSLTTASIGMHHNPFTRSCIQHATYTYYRCRNGGGNVRFLTGNHPVSAVTIQPAGKCQCRKLDGRFRDTLIT